LQVFSQKVIYATTTADEDSAKEEAKKQVNDGSLAYSKADVVVKFGGWDANHAKDVAQASLSALKQLILSDKKLPGNFVVIIWILYCCFFFLS